MKGRELPCLCQYSSDVIFPPLLGSNIATLIIFLYDTSVIQSKCNTGNSYRFCLPFSVTQKVKCCSSPRCNLWSVPLAMPASVLINALRRFQGSDSYFCCQQPGMFLVGGTVGPWMQALQGHIACLPSPGCTVQTQPGLHTELEAACWHRRGLSIFFHYYVLFAQNIQVMWNTLFSFNVIAELKFTSMHFVGRSWWRCLNPRRT